MKFLQKTMASKHQNTFLVIFSFITKPSFHTQSRATLYTDQTRVSQIKIFTLKSSLSFCFSVILLYPDFWSSMAQISFSLSEQNQKLDFWQVLTNVTYAIKAFSFVLSINKKKIIKVQRYLWETWSCMNITIYSYLLF